MSLRDYARKRRFGQTPEPEAQAQARRGRAPIFVVQLHHARARHYDFRLEVDGVLKSWAVPKGPSLRAGERRLAVEVEDHPLAYASFEGDIPQGHYGAGHVDLFDRGTWSAEGDPLERIGAGKLEFELDGERLHGRYTLVRTRPSGRQPQWLLIKRSDRYARDIDADGLLEGSAKPVRTRVQAKPKPPAAKKKAAAKAAARTAGKRWKTRAVACAGARVATMPDRVELQLATLRMTAPVGEDWLHEVKWDGYRMLGYGRRGAVRLESRNALDWTERLPRLIAALGELPAAQFIVDGELVALDADGRSDFARLQRELERGDNDDLRLVLFDLLYLDGVDLRACALRDRRALLRDLLAADPTPLLAFSEHIDGAGAQVFQAALDAGLEGIVSKRADAPYRGGRSGDWIKLKHAADESFVVVGYTPPKSSRKGFGSLLLATSERGGLRYVGRVGSGFSDEQLRTLTQRLQALRRQSPTVKLPGHVPFSAASVTWVAPRLTVDIHSRGRGKEGLVRQASFLRVRDDLTPPSDSTAMPATKLTHPERIVFPEDGISKAQVAAYYEAVAPWLLPELAQRPISLLRCPDGVGASCFFQKHHADSLGAGVHAIALKESSGRADYVYVDDVDGVLALVQMNTLEFHPWGAKVDDVERPDRLVFDLDPAEDVPWSELKRAARDVRDRLEELGLRSWPRLSGGKGMHVVVPIQRGPDWAAVKHFCEAFADAMVERTPLRYVATASKAKRQGRIFIDWLRNARGATSVASWSLRARAGAPVAMPLRWDELARVGAPNAFDLAKAQRRAARLRADPWEGFASARQRLPKL
ncbi:MULTISPECIES: DNA ligase D [unclassified Lysobacter]|uniref:DNA ligase D n=1 Tax=unclassified Lysobacter TaxID=2635362 RepID=UPI0006FF2D52|nr:MULTISPECIES: DNA ligase D [unclassified Lysobacter]KQZ67764.1 DNA ligase [Lysobacter sp. Root559]KRC38091.1 DNA ligase [Lysobacter sp. Root76]KRD69416.1 DNA ligase [Lysobacter sp. Root96]